MREGISERILELRKRNGWLQSELSRRSGISTAAISHFEGGGRMPSAKLLKQLAKTFNTSVDYLLGVESNFDKFEEELLYRKFTKLNQLSRDFVSMQIDWLTENPLKIS